jgi:tRNA (cmo5U34)-methyltransferase
MITSVQDNYSNDSMVKVIEHDLEFPLLAVSHFDAVVSAFAIHHLKQE